MNNVGIWLSINRGDYSGRAEVPDGTFAAVVTANDAWFAIDAAGNVMGDPEAVEREALSLDTDQNLSALAAVGLARIAMKGRSR